MAISGKHVLVIGGGLIGAASAVALGRAGAAVTLVDPGDERARASFGNAGHIVIESAEPLASWSQVRSAPSRLFAFGGPLDFRLSDIDLWAPWALEYLKACAPDRFRAGTAALAGLLARAIPAWRDIAEAIGRPELIEARGYFHLRESDRTARRGHDDLAHADLGPGRYRAATAAEITRLGDVFAGRPKGGAYFENTAKLRDPGLTVRALHAAIAQRGGEIVEGRAAKVEAGGGGAAAELDDGRRLGADMILIAAGARSTPLMAQLGARAPLVAERGYHLHFPEHHWPDDLDPVLFADRFIYMTRFETGARATSFTEIGRPNAPPDPRKWRALRRQVRELSMPVAGEGVEWFGSRPTLPDFLPAIGRLSPQALYAFGHQHIGATLAAATAEAIVELAGASSAPQRLKPFDLNRFRR